MDANSESDKVSTGNVAKHHAMLLKKVAEGDRDAFTELYKIFQPRLIKFCSRMLKNDIALAADMADEAMIEVWKSAGSFSGLSQASTWIHSIARFSMIGYLRKNKEVLQDDNFEQLNIDRIISICSEINRNSENVMKKIGMKKLGDFYHPKLKGYPDIEKCVCYEISNEM